jgi:hypothetical protein
VPIEGEQTLRRRAGAGARRALDAALEKLQELPFLRGGFSCYVSKIARARVRDKNGQTNGRIQAEFGVRTGIQLRS